MATAIVMPAHKTCNICHQDKPATAFSPNQTSRDGLRPDCKLCRSAQRRARYVSRAVKRTCPITKICTTCGHEKPFEQFCTHRRSPFGRTNTCFQCQRQKDYDYYHAHLDYQRGRARQYQAADTERNARKRAAYQANPHTTRMQKRAYNKAHPEIRQAAHQRRRARKRGVSINDFSHQQWVEMQEQQEHCCYYCGKRCKGHLTHDHLTPLVQGGAHTLHNIIAVCGLCNSKKGTSPPRIPVQPLLLTIAPARQKRGTRPRAAL